MLVVDAVGDASSLCVLELLVGRLCGLGPFGNRWSSLRRGRAEWFVDGALLVMFEGSTCERDVVGFKRYQGPCHVWHELLPRHSVSLVAPLQGPANALSLSHQFARLRSAMWRQVAAWESTQQAALAPEQQAGKSRHGNNTGSSSIEQGSGMGQLQAFIRLGCLYLLNLPRSFSSEMLADVTVAELEAALIKGRRAAEPWRWTGYDSKGHDHPGGPDSSGGKGSGDQSKPAGMLGQDGGGSDGEEENKDKGRGGQAGSGGGSRGGEGSGGSSAGKKRKTRKEKGIGQSLYTLAPSWREGRWARFLSQHGFQQVPVGSIPGVLERCFSVSVLLSAREWKVTFDEGLKLVNARERAVRWLAGSLKLSTASAEPYLGGGLNHPPLDSGPRDTPSNYCREGEGDRDGDDSTAGATGDDMETDDGLLDQGPEGGFVRACRDAHLAGSAVGVVQDGERWVRFYLDSHRALPAQRARLARTPLLVQSAVDPHMVAVAPPFRRRLVHVRKKVTQVFAGTFQGVDVAITLSAVEEFAEVDAQTGEFMKRKAPRLEVEACVPRLPLTRDVGQFDAFVRAYWELGLQMGRAFS
eukprot:jgi/Mesvir1/4752/Mv05540-RA.1